MHAVVAQSTFRSQNVQNTSASDHFWKLRCRKSARRCGAKHILKSKVEKTEGFGALLDVQMSFCTWGFCRISKNDGRLGTFEEDLQRCIFRGRRSTRDRDDFAWQVQHFVWPVSLFCGRRSSLDKCSGKITKRIGTRPSALHSTFHIWRKSRRIASFLMLSI